jgi:hypothetical protein
MKQILFMLCVIGSAVSALDWPAPDAVMIGNFGKNNAGTPALGTSFAAESTIQAAAGGELLFVHRQTDTASRLPSPLGVWFAVDQGDGLICLYSRVADEPDRVLPRRIEQSQTIAHTGQTGWSDRQGFYFSLYDRKERQWINPAKLATALPDTSAPVITGIELHNSAGTVVVPGQTNRLEQGRWNVFVAVNDLMNNNSNLLAPYRIVLLLNGHEVSQLEFEVMPTQNGTLLIKQNGLVPAHRVYAPAPAFDIGTVLFSRGQASLEIIASDFNGNIRSSVFPFIVE